MSAEVVHVSVDFDKCAGLGLCEAVAPDVFEVGADGYLTLLVSTTDGGRRRELEQAAEACPNQAITVHAAP